MNWADVFLYLVLLGVALWTARLAMSKRRNPWGWGGAALLLSLMPWHLLGVIPVLVLLFIKSPSASTALRPDRLACPRCAKSHTVGQHFCTGCGWDLSQAYSPEEQDGLQPSHTQAKPQTSMPSTAVAEPSEQLTEVTPAGPAAREPIVSNTEAVDFVEASVSEAADASSAGEATPATDAQANEPEEEPAKDHVPWGTYNPGVAPTAAVMTSRGIERFDEGKYQEAIDQFTKAIALDPNYVDAWQRRAEAYAQLGRSEQAAEDRRHLQGLDPSSSPG